MKSIPGSTSNEYDSFALPGKPVSIEAFINWIKESEKMSFISLEGAKKRWNEQKGKLYQPR